MMEFTTERLLIKKASADAVRSISCLNQPNGVTEYLSSLSAQDLEILFRNPWDVKDILDRIGSNLGDDDPLSYGAWNGNTLIGYISLINHSSSIPAV